MTRWGLQIASEAEDDLLAGAFAEFVVTDGSPLAGNPAASDMLAGQSAALVAVSRRGKAIAEALAVQAPQAGDVLLLQVAADRVPASAGAMGLLPLADRPIRLGLAPRDLLPLLALLGAIAAAGAGLTSLGLALLLGVIVLALAGRLPADAYRDIDWPVILLLAALILVVGLRGLKLVAGIREPMLLAFSTASSEAAYPGTLAALQKFGVSRKVASFVLPLGYSFNLDGSMMYCTFATLFIAQIYGIELTLMQQITMLGLLMVTSKGMAGVPKASIVVIAATLAYFGLPEAGIGIILAVDQLLDMGRSATNVVGNSVASAVVAKWENQIEDPQETEARPA